MNEYIDWEIPQNKVRADNTCELNKDQIHKPCECDISEDEAFIMTTYLTHVWQHAHEHTASAIPGTFPARKYDGQTISITLGRYEISLKFNVFDIEPERSEYPYQWRADIVDVMANDKLELIIESEYDYSPGFISSERGEVYAKELLKLIIRQCEKELNYSIDDAKELRVKISDGIDDMDEDDSAGRYPQWFDTSFPRHGS